MGEQTRRHSMPTRSRWSWPAVRRPRRSEFLRAGAALIRSAPHLQLLVEPELSVLLFERIGWELADYERWNAWLVNEQIGFVTPSRHQGRVCTRFAIVNPETTVNDLALIIDSMK